MIQEGIKIWTEITLKKSHFKTKPMFQEGIKIWAVTLKESSLTFFDSVNDP